MDHIINALALFAGVGGIEQALRRAGVRTVCYVERDPYSAAVIMSRIRGGDLDPGPIWDDARTFDARPWRGVVDLVVGGFPCQPASCAGRREGMADDRWLWPEFMRIAREVGAGWILGENVPGLRSVDSGRAFGTVLRDLADAGYSVEWDSISAADVGAPHRRERVFILARKQDMADTQGLAERTGLCEGQPPRERGGRSGDGCGQGSGTLSRVWPY